MHRIWIETLNLVWGEEDASLLAFDLCKEVLLLVVMCGRYIAYGERVLIENVTCEKRWGWWQSSSHIIRYYTAETVKLRASCPNPYPPCQWAAGWMSAVPSFSWLAACWSSSSWNQGSQQQSSSLLCHSGSAADIPLKCTRKETCKMYEPLCSTLGDLKQVATQLIFVSAIHVSAGYKLVYKVLFFQQATSPLNHEEQYGIKGSGQCKSK